MDKQRTGLREILSCAVFIAIIGAFLALNILTPPPAILAAERRMPAKFPELSWNTVINGGFMDKFEDYAADNFIFRDAFRGIHTFMVFDLYRLSDMSGIYHNKNIGLGEFRRTDESALRQSAMKIKKAAQSLSGLEMNIYYSLIPDKSIYAGKYMPGFDLDLTEAILSEILGDYPYIRLADRLESADFYRTDLHWDQTKITSLADYLLMSMGAGANRDVYQTATAGKFFGVYSGQFALPVDPDVLSYADITGLKASYLNERTLEFESGPVYEAERFSDVDPYDIFLRGPQPLIVIENEAAPERELYLFRDSFGSSLAPLLTSAYSKITLIDLRYINLGLLDMFIEFTPGSDALFIYGSQILNNPSVLQT